MNTMIKLGAADCALISYTATLINCISPAGVINGVTPTINQLGAISSAPVTITIENSADSIVSVTPSIISPGYKSSFKVKLSALEPVFPPVTGNHKNNYKVELIGATTSFSCRVVNVDIPNKELEVKFPGSEKDSYKVRATNYQSTSPSGSANKILGDSLLEAKFEITDFNPK